MEQKDDSVVLTPEEADTISAPLIAESPVNIECRVKDIIRMPSHDMFMAEITSVHVDERYVDEKGAYDFGSMDLVAFNHGKYYRLSAEELGFFGFSVMKPKTAKRKAAEKADQWKTKKTSSESTNGCGQRDSSRRAHWLPMPSKAAR